MPLYIYTSSHSPQTHPLLDAASRDLPDIVVKRPTGVAEYCAWSSPTPLHSTESYRRWGIRAEGKDIWWKSGVGILGEKRAGRHGLGVREARWERVERP